MHQRVTAAPAAGQPQPLGAAAQKAPHAPRPAACQGSPAAAPSPWHPAPRAVLCLHQAGVCRVGCRASAPEAPLSPVKCGRRSEGAKDQEVQGDQGPLAPQQPVADSEKELREELELQEQEVELSVDDLLQMQYEVPIDDEDDDVAHPEPPLDGQVAHQVSDGAPGGSTGHPHTEQQQQQQQQAQEEGAAPGLNRAAFILLELMAAAASGSSQLDAKIVQFADDIDEDMLQMLQARIDVVAQVDRNAAVQLQDLHAILRVVQQRTAASPATRLLDDVLDILGDEMGPSAATPDGGLPYAQRRLQAMERLREAFAGGISQGVDIFAAAAALAEAGPMAAAELASEAVSAEDFIRETTRTLVEAKQGQAQLGADIERADKELRYVQKRQPEVLKSPQAQQHLKQLAHAKRMHAQRAVALSQLQDVLLLARQASAAQGMVEDDDDDAFVN